MAEQRSIRYMIERDGISKGLYFCCEDLPPALTMPSSMARGRRRRTCCRSCRYR